MRTLTFQEYADERHKKLIERIVKLRERKNISQLQVAEYLNCSRTRIVRIEQGESIYSVAELELLTTLLELPADALTKITPDASEALSVAVTTEYTGKALTEHVAIPLKGYPVLLGTKRPQFSPNGQFVAIQCEGKGISLINLETSTISWTYDSKEMSASFSFSPNGKYLAVGLHYDVLVILDAENGLPHVTLDPDKLGLLDSKWWDHVHSDDLFCRPKPYFSPDNKWLATLNNDTGTIRIWNCTTWEYINTLYIGGSGDPMLPTYTITRVNGLQFEVDNTRLALWNEDSKIITYLGINGKGEKSIKLQHTVTSYENFFVFRASGADCWHIAGGSQQAISVWQDSSFEPKDRRYTSSGYIEDIKVIDHQLILAIVESNFGPNSLNGIKNVVNNRTVLLANFGEARFAAFSPDGKMLAYPDPQGDLLHIQYLDHEVLRSESSLIDFLDLRSDSDQAEAIQNALPVGKLPKYYPAVPHDESARRTLFKIKLNPNASVAENIRTMDEKGLAINAMRNGMYVIYTEEKPSLGLVDLHQVITQQTEKPTLLVNLTHIAQEKLSLSEREVIQAALNESLPHRYRTHTALKSLQSRYLNHIVFFDHAERISFEALTSFAHHHRPFGQMTFLVVHDKAKFLKTLERSSGWLEGRLQIVDIEDFLGTNAPVS